MPAYIKPFPTTIDSEDVEYLRTKGVLNLPDRDIRDACLASYFQHVQPMYPIVEPARISSILAGTASNNEKLSLLLLYAFIFVGGTWIDVRLVRKSGFLSRNAFRKSIHRKMRLLYDADYENDRECLIQVFILWTFWFEGPNENKDGWHWIGVALSLSRVIGLHQTASQSNQTKAAMNRLRRRLWWSLATRDVICSFSLSRCPRIADLDYNVDMLEVTDFESPKAPAAVLGTIPQTLQHQQTVAQICVLYTKLVHIFGKICKAAYLESSCGKSSVLYSSQQLQGKDSININRKSSMTEQLALFQRHLDSWRQNVPDDLWHVSSIPSNMTGPESVEVVHRGLLSMMYYATVMVLHRPQMLSVNPMDDGCDSSATPSPDPARTMVRFAARQIIQIAMDFYQEDMVKSLAATCITCLILASISQIFDMLSKEEMIRSEASQRLEQCKAIFHAFSEQQVGGQWALEVISYIIYRLEHQRRGQPADGSTIKGNLNPNSVQGASVILSHGDSNDTSQLTSSRNPSLATEVRECSMTELLDEEIPDVSATPSAPPTFDDPRLVFNNTDALFSPSTWEQPLPDGLMGFLGTDFVWPDFPNTISEHHDNLTWTSFRSDRVHEKGFPYFGPGMNSVNISYRPRQNDEGIA